MSASREEPALEVVAALGLCTVQDAGRPGRMHEGVPPGGALVPEQLARANASVHNAAEEAGVEIVGTLRVLAQAAVTVGDDAGTCVRLAAGDRWEVGCGSARVRYAAIRGGIAVPAVLGGRGTLVVAHLGGLEGRPLRRGDRLRAAAAPRQLSAALPPPGDAGAPIRVVPGPDLDRFEAAALDVLLRGAFRVSPRSDRVGVRLTGPQLPRRGGDAAVSAPMVRGAIQVPSSGEPIVLGPDHPTTGGYPVLATLVRADVGVLMARPVGAAVRFARA